jgi:hypothetical protein
VRRKGRAVLKVGKVIDVDQRGNRPAMLADRYGAVASPRLSDSSASFA